MSFWDIVWFIIISFAFVAYLMMLFSIITDLCLPDALEPATVEKIIAVANGAEPKLTRLVSGVLERL